MGFTILVRQHLYIESGPLWHCDIPPVIFLQNTVWCRYITHQFSWKPSQKTPHSLPVRARYGMSFVGSHSDIYYAMGSAVIYAISYCIGLHYNGTQLYSQKTCRSLPSGFEFSQNCDLLLSLQNPRNHYHFCALLGGHFIIKMPSYLYSLPLWR